MPSPGEPDAHGADTFTLAVDYLDWYGDVVLHRLAGLDQAQQTTSVVPSGWSALGMVKHCAATLRYWTRHVFEGTDVDFSWPGTEEQEWEIAPGDTPDSVRAFFEQERSHSPAVLRAHRPGATSQRDYGGTGVHPTLAWVLLHLLQETARHAGHLDVSRELTDGRTGVE